MASYFDLVKSRVGPDGVAATADEEETADDDGGPVDSLKAASAYYRYSYCGAIIVVGVAVNLAALVRIIGRRRRRPSAGGDQQSGGQLRRTPKGDRSFAVLVVLACVANLLLLLVRDTAYLLEQSGDWVWQSTNFVCKLYKFAHFLTLHLCSYSLVLLVGWSVWRVYAVGRRRFRARYKLATSAAVVCAVSVAFCAPLYHVSGVDDPPPANDGRPLSTWRWLTSCATFSVKSAESPFGFYPHFLAASVLVVPAAVLLVGLLLLTSRSLRAGRRQPDQLIVRLTEVDERSFEPEPDAGRRTVESGQRQKPPVAKRQRTTEISELVSFDGDFRNFCRRVCLLAVVYLICWLPYGVVFLLVARRDLNVRDFRSTIPTHILFTLYPILSGVVLLI